MYHGLSWPQLSYVAEDDKGKIVGYVLAKVWTRLKIEICQPQPTILITELKENKCFASLSVSRLRRGQRMTT